MKQRIVVLGANGFIGRRVVHILSNSDWAQPVAASRRATASGLAPGIEALDIDASEPESLRRALVGAAGVVNCMAGAAESILSISKSLFDAASTLSPRPNLVHLSSLAAYGSAVGIVDEAAPLLGDLDAYSDAKAQSDRLGSGYDFVVILRPGIVYGPGSPWWSDRIARLLVTGRLGDLGPSGEGICNLVHVDDVAAAAARALRLPRDVRGAYNLSSAAPLTWNEYFARYAAALGALPVRSISVRRLAVETRLLSAPLKALEIALRSPSLSRWNPLPPIRPWLPGLCSRKIRMDVSRAERILGMDWTPLEAGLEQTAGWFRAGGRTAL